MKKISLSLVVLTLLSTMFISCKKDSSAVSSGGDYYMKGKKDGVAFNFTTNTRAMVTTAGSASLLNLIAFGNGSEGFNLGINFSGTATLQPGVYTEDYSGSDYVIGGVYNPNSTEFVYGAGIQGQSAKPLTITVLTKTNTEVTGTFSGAFYKQSTSGTFYSDYITITEGEFRLKIN